MNVYWPYIFVSAASFFNACLDCFENENFFESIFKDWNQRFWYKRESWKHAKKIFNYKVDAWHIAKSCMIICFVMAIITFKPIHQWWVHLISLGILWNFVFWLFYHEIFKVK